MVNDVRLVDRLASDLRDEFEEVLKLAQGADMRQQTPAVGWDIRRTVEHLHSSDLSARIAIADPEKFLAERPRRPDEFRAMHQRQSENLSGLNDAELLEAWREGLERLLATALAAAPETRHPWYGPPMSIASSLTARLMEYWAHGEDIADARGVQRSPSPRLRHICHLGVRTYAFSFRNRDLLAPVGEPRVELTSPTGDLWVWGHEDAADAVRGDALDFARLVTRRRHRSDTTLQTNGANADAWLDIAQCFAGPPGAGRAPRNGEQ